MFILLASLRGCLTGLARVPLWEIIRQLLHVSSLRITLTRVDLLFIISSPSTINLKRVFRVRPATSSSKSYFRYLDNQSRSGPESCNNGTNRV
ncbi:hypothetical protein B0T13DRAFT_232466 [Neurospora crassa]|nr:hypothetical protein B0T13DRAFT_232466 [Neurospora crassa]